MFVETELVTLRRALCFKGGRYAHSYFTCPVTIPPSSTHHSRAHGAFVTAICAAVDPEPGASPRDCLEANEPLEGPGGILEYGIPGPGGGGILVACAHGAAVPEADGGGGAAVDAGPDIMGWFVM